MAGYTHGAITRRMAAEIQALRAERSQAIRAAREMARMIRHKNRPVPAGYQAEVDRIRRTFKDTREEQAERRRVLDRETALFDRAQHERKAA